MLTDNGFATWERRQALAAGGGNIPWHPSQSTRMTWPSQVRFGDTTVVSADDAHWQSASRQRFEMAVFLRVQRLIPALSTPLDDSTPLR